jgi:indole-3-glycerol phosphate synthase
MGCSDAGVLMSDLDYLSPILARKAREVTRRRRHQLLRVPRASESSLDAPRIARAVACLRRDKAQPVRVIAEIKRRSPSAGELRARGLRDIEWLVGEYQAGGAAAISVLCDRPGFAGSPLDLRRAARVTQLPLLFKEFVLDEVQIELARALGADMLLLVVRALPGARLHALVDATLAAGIAPVVEAANVEEVEAALRTRAPIIGVNARDLRTFRVEPSVAHAVLARVDAERVAVHMSGVHNHGDLMKIGAGRADAVLIGESLMRAVSPARKLAELLRGE